MSPMYNADDWSEEFNIELKYEPMSQSTINKILIQYKNDCFTKVIGISKTTKKSFNNKTLTYKTNITQQKTVNVIKKTFTNYYLLKLDGFYFDNNVKKNCDKKTLLSNNHFVELFI